MLILLMIFLAVGFVALWIEQQNLEERHLLIVVLILLYALMWIVVVPWQVQLAIFILLLNLNKLPISKISFFNSDKKY